MVYRKDANSVPSRLYGYRDKTGMIRNLQYVAEYALVEDFSVHC